MSLKCCCQHNQTQSFYLCYFYLLCSVLCALVKVRFPKCVFVHMCDDCNGEKTVCLFVCFFLPCLYEGVVHIVTDGVFLPGLFLSHTEAPKLNHFKEGQEAIPWNIYRSMHLVYICFVVFLKLPSCLVSRPLLIEQQQVVNGWAVALSVLTHRLLVSELISQLHQL